MDTGTRRTLGLALLCGVAWAFAVTLPTSNARSYIGGIAAIVGLACVAVAGVRMLLARH